MSLPLHGNGQPQEMNHVTLKHTSNIPPRGYGPSLTNEWMVLIFGSIFLFIYD